MILGSTRSLLGSVSALLGAISGPVDVVFEDAYLQEFFIVEPVGRWFVV